MGKSIINGEEVLILYINKDFTTRKLVNFLNVKYGQKKDGSKFTLGDIQQYLMRGYLPRAYGHHPIERIYNEETGLKFIRVYTDRTVR